MKKKIIILLLALGLSMSGCAGSETSSEEKVGVGVEESKEPAGQVEVSEKEETDKTSGDESIFSVAMDLMPARLDATEGGDSMLVITYPIYDPLYFFVEEGVEYRLAENLDISEDGKTYTITLNKDAKWSDGEPITSDDLIFSINYDEYRKGSSNVKVVETTGEDVEINVIDDKTVEFILPAVHDYYIRRLQNIKVFPAHPFDGDVVKADQSDYFEKPGMATSGAYEVAEINDDSLVYTARDNYYRGKANTDKVIMKLLGAGSSREMAFESGGLSYLRITTSQQFEKYERQLDKYNLVSYPEGRLNYIQVNPYGPVMSTLTAEAREAIFLALDQQEIMDAVYGSDTLASLANSILTPQVIGYNPNNKAYDFNLEKAQELADKSGLVGKTLIYKYNKDRVNMEQVAVVAQQQLARIGVNVEVIGEDAPTFFANVFMAWKDNPEEQANWDLMTNGWDSRTGVHSGVMTYLNRPEKWGWSQEIADLTIQMNEEPNQEKRVELLGEIQGKAMDEHWMYPLPYINFVVVSQKNVSGLDSTHIVPEFGDYVSITVE